MSEIREYGVRAEKWKQINGEREDEGIQTPGWFPHGPAF
jgi:hypothetical protein